MAANWPSPGATWMDSWRGDAKVRKWASWLRSLHAQEGIILLQKAVGTIPTHLFAKVLHQCTVLQLCWHTVASCDICHHFFQAKRSQHVLYRYTMNMRAQFVYISSLVICGHGSGTLSSPTPLQRRNLCLSTSPVVSSRPTTMHKRVISSNQRRHISPTMIHFLVQSSLL